MEAERALSPGKCLSKVLKPKGGVGGATTPGLLCVFASRTR